LIDFVTSGSPIKHAITPESIKKGRGEIVGVYFIAKLTNGEWTSPEVMSVDEVNAVRDAYSKKSAKGEFSAMWRNSWGEAARKTVTHRAKKRLPLGGNLDQLGQGDDEISFDNETGEVFEAKPEAPKKTTTRAAAAVKKQAEEEKKAEVGEADYVDVTESAPDDDAYFGDDDGEEIPV